MNPDSALTHGLGMGVEMASDPLALSGLSALGGASRAAATAAPAAEAAGSVLSRRLGQFAGPGLDEAAGAAASRATQQIPMQPGSQLARQMEAMTVERPALAGAPAPMVSPQVTGRLNRAAGAGLDYQMGRATDAAQHAVMPNFSTPLASQQYLGNAGGSFGGGGGGNLMDRLQRMARPAVQAID